MTAIRTTITVDVQALNDAKAQAKKNGESLKSFLERVEILMVNPKFGVTSFFIRDATDKVRALC